MHTLTFTNLVRRSLLQLLLLLPLTAFCQEKSPLSQLPLDRLLTLGYELLPKSQSEALPYFEEALRRDPGSRNLQEQVGYIDMALGRPADALARFRASLALQSSDTTRLQIAYLLSTLGRNDEAMAAFADLCTSANATIRSQARAETILFPQRKCEQQYPWWWKAYAAPYFEGRFRDVIIEGSLYGGKYMTQDRQFSLFGLFALSRDTRSIGGALPIIYSDNYALLAAGLRVQPLAGLTADVQGGIAQDLLQRPGEASFRGDFRALLAYGTGWYPALQVPDRLQCPFSSFGDLYAAGGYYSRYANWIGAVQMRAGLRILELENSAVDLYLRADAIGDSRREYFNNVLEGSVGARIIPDHRWSLVILAELHRGTYWGSSASPNPYGSPYTSGRIILIFDRFFCW